MCSGYRLQDEIQVVSKSESEASFKFTFITMSVNISNNDASVADYKFSGNEMTAAQV